MNGEYLVIAPKPKPAHRCTVPGGSNPLIRVSDCGAGTVWVCGACEQAWLLETSGGSVFLQWNRISARSARKAARRHERNEGRAA